MTQEKEKNRQAEQGKAETEIPCSGLPGLSRWCRMALPARKVKRW